MTETEALAIARARIGYEFQNEALLVSALTHASVADHRLASNERMEFLGDAILGMVICEFLYKRFPDYLEGELTKIKSAVVSRKTCATIARDIGLPDVLFLGKGMSGRHLLPSSLAAAVLESLIAAIYLDGGLEAARAFILEHMAPYVEGAANSENQNNFKSHLQQYAQKTFSATPMYEILDEKGPDHSKCFEVCVVVGSRRFPSAWGPSKKEAEQKAAFNALLDLNLVAPDD